MVSSHPLVEVLARLMVKMPTLRGVDFKVAFYLVLKTVSTGSAEISMSERALAAATGISKTSIQVALRRLSHSGLFLREPGGYNRPDRFLLPAFRPAGVVPILGTSVALNLAHPVPEFDPPGGPVNGTPVPETGPLVGLKTVQDCLENGTPVPETDPAPYKERAGARRNRIESIGSSRVSIDRCLAQTTLDSDQADDARTLRAYLRSYAARAGCDTLAGAEIDDKIVAQCLAIAPLGRLQDCLFDLGQGKMGKPRTFAWFVSVFLERLHGYTPTEVAAAREALRVKPKPAGEARADLPFVAGIQDALARGAKGIK